MRDEHGENDTANACTTEVSYRADGRLQNAAVPTAKRWYGDRPAADAIRVACNKRARFVLELPGSVIEEIATEYSLGVGFRGGRASEMQKTTRLPAG